TTSLEAMIEISDEALEDDARQALRAASVFPPKPNTFSEEAVLATAATSTTALDALIDVGLVEVNRLGRYTLHQTIADYASLKYTDTTAEKRMAEYFANYVSFLSRTSERSLGDD